MREKSLRPSHNQYNQWIEYNVFFPGFNPFCNFGGLKLDKNKRCDLFYCQILKMTQDTVLQHFFFYSTAELTCRDFQFKKLTLNTRNFRFLSCTEKVFFLLFRWLYFDKTVCKKLWKKSSLTWCKIKERSILTRQYAKSCWKSIVWHGAK